MESSTTSKGYTGPAVSAEFGVWPIEGATFENTNAARVAYNTLLAEIVPMFGKGNERYLSIVKTKLEEACLFTIKGIGKPVGGN